MKNQFVHKILKTRLSIDLPLSYLPISIYNTFMNLGRAKQRMEILQGGKNYPSWAPQRLDFWSIRLLALLACAS